MLQLHLVRPVQSQAPSRLMSHADENFGMSIAQRHAVLLE